MKKNEPMFDIEDSEDVTITNNETSSERLLKAKKINNLKAKENKAGTLSNTTSNYKWHETYWGKIIIGIIIGVIVLVIGYHFTK